MVMKGYITQRKITRVTRFEQDNLVGIWFAIFMTSWCTISARKGWYEEEKYFHIA